MIAGGMSGVATFMVTGSGLVAAPAPGSIFAYFAVTPKGGYFGVILGILISCLVTFAVASVLLKFGRGEPAEETDDPADGSAGRSGDGSGDGSAGTDVEADFARAKADSDARHEAARSRPVSQEV
jgi:PTS system mannitol-specific IIC component